MRPLRTIIIDDEWLIRSELSSMLSAYPSVEIIGEAANVPDAARLIDNCRPDLVFLDIHLSGRSGLDLLTVPEKRFKLVFISAHDQYLKQSIRYEPVDFLLKPISKEKLKAAVKKALNS